MNDTPRTDLKAVVPLDIHSCLEFCRRIERDLNAANFDNEKLIEANRFYAMDKSELEHELAAKNKEAMDERRERQYWTGEAERLMHKQAVDDTTIKALMDELKGEIEGRILNGAALDEAKSALAIKGFICSICGTFHIQQPTCITCGAQKLYDATLKFAEQRAEAAKEDQKRLEWVMPIITGCLGPDVDKWTLALGNAIMEGLEGRACIDRAMK
jgi:hypothetical protein